MNKLLSAVLLINVIFFSSCTNLPSNSMNSNIATPSQHVSNRNTNIFDRILTTEANSNTSQSIVDTSNWPSFTHNKDGYSLSYPAELKVDSNTGVALDDSKMRFWSAQIVPQEGLGSFADIIIYTGRLADLETAVREDMDNNIVSVLERNDTVTNGNAASAILFSYKEEMSVQLKRYYIQISPDRLFVMTGSLSDEAKLNALAQNVRSAL